MEKELAKNISTEARKARVDLGMTQEDAAERIGVTVEFYSRIERGNALPSLKTFIRMAVAFGVSTDKLIGLAPDGGDAMSVLQKYQAPEPEYTPEIRKLVRRLRESSEGPRRMVDIVIREWSLERARLAADLEAQLRTKVRAEVLAEFGLSEEGQDDESGEGQDNESSSSTGPDASDDDDAE